MTAHERAQAAEIDLRLRERGLWPGPDDEVLGMYHRWAAIS